MWIDKIIRITLLPVSYTHLDVYKRQSRVCFIATSTGLLVNLILDPILIFGLMGLPKMRVLGAALATLIAQMTVFCIYLFIAKKEVLFEHMQVWKGCLLYTSHLY